MPCAVCCSVLSALYVAGLNHVYVHGEAEPTGPWWRQLRTHNVTFLSAPAPTSPRQPSASLALDPTSLR